MRTRIVAAMGGLLLAVGAATGTAIAVADEASVPAPVTSTEVPQEASAEATPAQEPPTTRPSRPGPSTGATSVEPERAPATEAPSVRPAPEQTPRTGSRVPTAVPAGPVGDCADCQTIVAG